MRYPAFKIFSIFFFVTERTSVERITQPDDFSVFANGLRVWAIYFHFRLCCACNDGKWEYTHKSI